MDALTAARPVTPGLRRARSLGGGRSGTSGTSGHRRKRVPPPAQRRPADGGGGRGSGASLALAGPAGCSWRVLRPAMSSSQVRPLVGWGLRGKEGLPDPVPGEGTRKTILAVKEACQCFCPSGRDREGLNIPGVPGDSPRKGRRGKVPFGLRQETRFSFKAVFVYVGPEGGVPLH